MEAAFSSDTLINKKTTRRNNQEHHKQNLTSTQCFRKQYPFLTICRSCELYAYLKIHYENKLANAVCENNRCLLNSGSVKVKVGDTYSCHCALKELTDEDRKTLSHTKYHF